MKTMIKLQIKIAFVFLFTFLSISCEKSVLETEQSFPGDIISANSQQVYSQDDIKQIFTAYQIPDSFAVAHAVEAITITYYTTDARGKKLKASGALLIPKQVNNLPIMSIQHGTETKRDRVASVSPLNSVEGISGLLLASLGYVTCIPDYPGFGVSTTVHPYMHAQSLSKPVIDFLIAAKSYCNKHAVRLNDQLYLAGYSEGGYVTLAVQKEIEDTYAEHFNIIAAAPMAGPYDLKLTTDFLFQQTHYNYPAYIAFFLYAYDQLYGWNRLDEMFNAPYNALIPALFDGTKTFFEINDQLPENINSLLKQSFISAYLNGSEPAFASALEENSLLDWTPVAPIHFFHGDADDVSPYQNTVNAFNSLKANGGTNIQLTTIPGGTHETASLPALFGAIEWLEAMRTKE